MKTKETTRQGVRNLNLLGPKRTQNKSVTVVTTKPCFHPKPYSEERWDDGFGHGHSIFYCTICNMRMP